MDDKELIQQLKQFQSIKADKAWADWLLSNILSRVSDLSSNSEKQSLKPKIKLVSFSFLYKYQKALIPAVLAIFFISTIALAQTSLPGNPLYTVKILTQDLRIALTPNDYKPVIRMQIAKSRLEDIAKTADKEKAVALLTQNIQKDLKNLPQELKNISPKVKTLDISKKVQNEVNNLNKIIAKTPLQASDKANLEKTTQETQNQVLSLILETEDKINNCPTYLQEKLAKLQTDFTNQMQTVNQWSPEEISKVRVLLAEVADNLKAGNCLEAMEKLESINQILQIHSLDIKVETISPSFK